MFLAFSRLRAHSRNAALAAVARRARRSRSWNIPGAPAASCPPSRAQRMLCAGAQGCAAIFSRRLQNPLL
jgi:hypothetical protein